MPYAATTPLECAGIFNAVLASKKNPRRYGGGRSLSGRHCGCHARRIESEAASLVLYIRGLAQGEGGFAAGEFLGTVEEVRANVSRWADKIELHKGLFPASAAEMEAVRFLLCISTWTLRQHTCRAGMVLAPQYAWRRTAVP